MPNLTVPTELPDNAQIKFKNWQIGSPLRETREPLREDYGSTERLLTISCSWLGLRAVTRQAFETWPTLAKKLRVEESDWTVVSVGGALVDSWRSLHVADMTVTNPPTRPLKNYEVRVLRNQPQHYK